MVVIKIQLLSQLRPDFNKHFFQLNQHSPILNEQHIALTIKPRTRSVRGESKPGIQTLVELES